MVLDYLDVQIVYERLLEILKVDYFGASAYNLNYLASLGLAVTVDIHNMTVLREVLASGSPIIAFINTGELSYWPQITDHAVVVIRFDEDQILINDPAFEEHPLGVINTKFELAWLRFDYLGAVIKRLDAG